MDSSLLQDFEIEDIDLDSIPEENVFMQISSYLRKHFS